ncbi:MAG TPA: hypothetical protein VGH33_08830 [Isosphaeraceae bacterium]
MRRIAAARTAGEPPDHTLQPTALVHVGFDVLSFDGSDVTGLQSRVTCEVPSA